MNGDDRARPLVTASATSPVMLRVCGSRATKTGTAPHSADRGAEATNVTGGRDLVAADARGLSASPRDGAVRQGDAIPPGESAKRRRFAPWVVAPPDRLGTC